MTKKEMTEVFAVMMLAWPSAELFKGGVAKLAPTIELWASCLSEVDMWTAQRAVGLLCRECKYPPTIAEFREKAERVTAEVQEKINYAFSQIKLGEKLYGSLTAYFEQLLDDSFDKAVIRMMGGPDNLVITLDDGSAMWNVRGYETSYVALLREKTPERRFLSE